MLGDGKKVKNYFSSSRDFSRKADSIILLGFKCTINPRNVIEMIRAIFEKIKIVNFFFFIWNTGTLNFKCRWKIKNSWTLDIKFEQDQSISFSTTVANGLSYTHTHTHTHTHTQKQNTHTKTDTHTQTHICTHTHTHTHTPIHTHTYSPNIFFRMWEWYRIKIYEANFFVWLQ